MWLYGSGAHFARCKATLGDHEHAACHEPRNGPVRLGNRGQRSSVRTPVIMHARLSTNGDALGEVRYGIGSCILNDRPTRQY